ncbi:MAG: PAS domain S-box protein [Candidatus Odinarchaeota archaeon]
MISDGTNSKISLEEVRHLREKAKELDCLYNVSKLLLDKCQTVDAILRRCIELIPPAFHFPDITCARITFAGKEITSKHYHHMLDGLSADILVQGEKIGSLDVYYLEKKGGTIRNSLLVKKKDLIITLASGIGAYLERKLLKRQLEDKMLAEEPILETIADHITPILHERLEKEKQERALLESEEKYRSMVEALDDLVYICSPDYRVEYMNSKMIQRTGRDATGELCYKALHDIDDICPWCVNEIIQQGKLHKWEVTSPKDDQTYFVSNVPIFHTDGTISKMAVIRNITESKLAEKLLEKERDTAQQYLDIARVLIIALDFGGRITLINKRGCEILEYEEEELIGKDWFTTCLPAAIREEIRTVFGKLMAGEITAVEDYENVIITKTGKRKMIYWHNSLIKDEEGKIIGTLSSGEDITSRKKAEGKLRESEQKYRQLVELSPYLIAIHGDGGISFCNQAGLDLLGASSIDQVIGKPVTDFVAPKLRDISKTRIQTAIQRDKQSPLYEQKIIRLDGEERDIEVVGIPFDTEEGKTIQIMARDITKEKQLEQEQKTYIAFLENMDSINTAIHSSTDLEEMMFNALKAVLSLFGCDRVWLIDPCDPGAPSWRVPMEVTSPDYPGNFVLREDIPMTPEIAEVFQKSLDSDEPVAYDPSTEHQLPPETAKQFFIKSQLVTDIHPKIGSPWMFGLHQCSYPRVWTNVEKRTFNEISHRFADALSSLLYLRSLRESESALRAEKEKYKTLFEESPVALWEEDLSEVKVELDSLKKARIGNFRAFFDVNPQTVKELATKVKVLDVNNATLKMLNTENKEELLGNLDKVISEETYEAFKEEFIALAEGKTSIRLESTSKAVTGEERCFILGMSVSPDHESTLSRVLVSTLDITAKKQAELALEKEKKRYQSLFDDAPVGILTCDTKGNIQNINNAAIQLLGSPSKEASKQINLVKYSPLIEAGFTNNFEICIGQQIEVSDQGYYMSKWGNYRHFNYKMIPLIDRTGQVSEVICVLDDTTEQKRMEEELQRSEQKYRDLVNLLPQTVFELDLDANITFLNHHGLVKTGYTQDDMEKGLNIFQLFTPDKLGRIEQDFQLSLNGEETTDHEYSVVMKDGTTYPALVYSSPIIHSEKPAGIRGIIIDISERKKVETELRASEEKYRRLVDTSPDGIVLTDLEGNIMMLNRQAARMSGFGDPSELIGKNSLEFFLPEDQSRAVEKLQDTLSRGITRNTQYVLVRNDGSTYWAELSASTILDTSGKPKCFMAVLRDITERKRAEQAIRESEKLYRSLFETSRDAISVVDLDGQFIDCNPAFERMFGYKLEDLSNFKMVHLTAERWRIKEEEIIENQVVGRGYSDVYFRESVRKDGSTFPVSVRAWLMRDEHGAPEKMISIIRDVSEELLENELSRLKSIFDGIDGFITVSDAETGIILSANMKTKEFFGPNVIGRTYSDVFKDKLRDRKSFVHRKRLEDQDQLISWEQYNSALDKHLLITERFVIWPDGKKVIFRLAIDITVLKEIELALQKSREEYKSITDLSREFIVRFSFDGIISYMNKSALVFFGSTSIKSLDKIFFNFIHPDDIARAKTVFTSIIDEEKLIEGFTCRVTVPWGVRFVEWNASAVTGDDGVLIGVQSSGRDVTELQKEIIEKDKLAAVGRLAAGIAHELNTPLANISLTVEYLTTIIEKGIESTDSNALLNELADIDKTVDFCAKIVEGLLQYSRKYEILVNEIPVEPLLKEIVSSPAVMSRIVDSNIELTLNVEKNLAVTGDKVLLAQVFQNIVNNAIDALEMVTRTPIIKITAVASGSYVAIRIIDNGRGIKQEHLDKLFEPFFSTKKIGKGTGLGLSISKGIIEKHQGKIGITSTPDEETEVTVTLPIGAVGKQVMKSEDFQ